LSERHLGRSANPVTKTAGLGWLEFEKPQLDPVQRFAIDFGFAVEDRSAHQLVLRCSNAGVPALVIRRGDRSRKPAPPGIVYGPIPFQSE